MDRIKPGTLVRFTGGRFLALTMDAKYVELLPGALAVVASCLNTHSLYMFVGFDGHTHQWLTIEPYWEVVDGQG